jgi:hypothetical protein
VMQRRADTRWCKDKQETSCTYLLVLAAHLSKMNPLFESSAKPTVRNHAQADVDRISQVSAVFDAVEPIYLSLDVSAR